MLILLVPAVYRRAPRRSCRMHGGWAAIIAIGRRASAILAPFKDRRPMLFAAPPSRRRRRVERRAAAPRTKCRKTSAPHRRSRNAAPLRGDGEEQGRLGRSRHRGDLRYGCLGARGVTVCACARLRVREQHRGGGPLRPVGARLLPQPDPGHVFGASPPHPTPGRHTPQLRVQILVP